MECTICIGNFEEGQRVVRVGGCEHVFHEGCIEGWIRMKARCPNCNKELGDSRQEEMLI